MHSGKHKRISLLSITCLGLSVFLILSLLYSSALTETELSVEPSPPPAPGYESRRDIMIAFLGGKLKMLTPKVPLPPGVKLKSNIEYGKVGQRSLLLDLYSPKNLTKPVPGLIFIHGGGWSGGDKQVYRLHASRYAQRGYVTASISYRFSGEAPFPAAVQDAKCAVRWMRAQGKPYNIDPNNIAVLGGSAGGHLAMMVGFSSDVAELEGNGGHQHVSSRPQAVVNLYGPSDLRVPFARQSDVVHKFLGGKKYDQSPELYRKASPIYYLTRDDPPTLILHGTLDEVVPIDQSDALVAMLKVLEVPYTYDRLQGWPHTMDIAEPVFNRCVFFIDRLLAQHMPLPTPAQPSNMRP